MSIVFNAHSQFIYTKQGNTHNNFLDVFEETNTNNLLVSCINATVNPSSNFEQNRSTILKISPIGLMIDSFNIGQNFLVNGKMLNYNNQFYIYGVDYSSSDMNSRCLYPTIIKYDANFNELKKIRVDSICNDLVSAMQNTVIINDQLYFTYFYLNSQKAKLFKLSLNLEINDTLTYAAWTVTSMIKQGSNLLIAGGGFPNSSPLGRSQAQLIDTSFNVINRFNFDSITTFITTNCSGTLGIFPQFCNLVEISNNSYYAAGFFPIYQPNNCSSDGDQAVYAVVKNNSQIVKGNYYGTSGGVREDGANFTASAIKQGSYIYNVCVSNMTNNNYFGNHYTPTSILTAKIDTSGNLIWQKYFNTPGFFYQPAGLYATADSGVVIVGRRYDTLAPAFINAFEGFVLKLDKNGNQVFTGINDNGIVDSNGFNLFPNPTNGVFNLFIGGTNEEMFSYKVTNSLGQEIVSDKLESNKSQAIDLTGNGAGVYFVTIKGVNGIKTEKLILQK